ncbi:RraA family protein [Candidatus Latescibacterota bacterium]
MNREEDITKVHDIPYPYSVSSNEMVERFERCYIAALHDVMSNIQVENSMHIQSTWLGPDIKCLTMELKRDVVAGFAFTIQWIKDPSPDKRDRPASKMLGSYFKNAVLCVDTGRDPQSGYLGELNTNAMIQSGVRASVIDGGAKDSGFVKLMDFPVFCRFTSPIDAYTENRLRSWQIPIVINGVRIEPMDVIVGDSDGVIVIPKSLVEDVLIRVEARKKQEDDTRKLIKSGMRPEEAAEKMGYKDL